MQGKAVGPKAAEDMNPARIKAIENWRSIKDCPNRPIIPLREGTEQQQRAHLVEQEEEKIREQNHWTIRPSDVNFVPKDDDRGLVFFADPSMSGGYGFSRVLRPGDSVKPGHPYLRYLEYSNHPDHEIGGGIVPDDVDLWYAIVNLKRSDDIIYQVPRTGDGTQMRIRLKAEKNWDVFDDRANEMIRLIDRGISENLGSGSHPVALLYDVVLNRNLYTTRTPETLTTFQVESPEPVALEPAPAPAPNPPDSQLMAQLASPEPAPDIVVVQGQPVA